MLIYIVNLIGWCNTCLQGLPPFQEAGSIPHRPSLSTFQWLIPSYRFTASGNITQWRIYVMAEQQFELKFQVWRTCLQRFQRSLCKIGENEVTQAGTGLVIYDVPISERILVNSRDFVGLHVSSSVPRIQCSSDFMVNILLDEGNNTRLRLANQPAPILTAVLSK